MPDILPDPRDPVTYADFQALAARVAALEAALHPEMQAPATPSSAQLVSQAETLLQAAEAQQPQEQQPA